MSPATPNILQNLTSLDSDGLLALARANSKAHELLKNVVLEFNRRKNNRGGKLRGHAQRCFDEVLQIFMMAMAERSPAPPLSLLPVSLSPVPSTPRRAPALYHWQREALAKWKAAGCRGIVEAVTGSGKTNLGMEAIAIQLAHNLKSAVIVPSLALADQWVDRLEFLFPEAKIGRLGGGSQADINHCDILVATVQSASKFEMGPRSRHALLVADEVHRFGAEKFSLALEDTFDRRLGLSATWQRADGDHETYLRPYFGEVVYTLNYQRARQQDTICDFSLALVGVDLSEDEREIFDEVSANAARLRSNLISRHGVPAEPIAKFMKAVSEFAKGGHGRTTTQARMYLSAFSQVQRILAETSAKIECATNLGASVELSERTIAFTTTIKAAESVSGAWEDAGVASAVIHSGQAQHDRRQTMAAFREGRLQALVAAKVLDEGIDVPDADVGIIVSTSRSRIQLIQRIGRILRKKPSGGSARIALLYIRNTREDPLRGAHDEALADIREAASEVIDFDGVEEVDELVDFLTS